MLNRRVLGPGYARYCPGLAAGRISGEYSEDAHLILGADTRQLVLQVIALQLQRRDGPLCGRSIKHCSPIAPGQDYESPQAAVLSLDAQQSLLQFLVLRAVRVRHVVLQCCLF